MQPLSDERLQRLRSISLGATDPWSTLSAGVITCTVATTFRRPTPIWILRNLLTVRPRLAGLPVQRRNVAERMRHHPPKVDDAGSNPAIPIAAG